VICKHELVVDATLRDDESVVGDECHIISPQQEGPRHNPDFPKKRLDSYSNLILLCRTHHKMVDDQVDTYTIDNLHKMKANHEKWVKEKLNPTMSPELPRIKRIKENIPTHLHRLRSGKEIFHIVYGACASLFDNDELETREEVDLIGGFFQTVRDWGDIGPDLEPGDHVRVAFELTQAISDLEQAGFFVFGAREEQIMEGGIGGPTSWPVAILSVLRKTNKEIVFIPL
jgi:hypothetical protein